MALQRKDKLTARAAIESGDLLRVLSMAADFGPNVLVEKGTPLLYLVCSSRMDAVVGDREQKNRVQLQLATNLLRLGADPNQPRGKCSDDSGEGETPLMAAAWLGTNSDLVALLLRHGGNPRLLTPAGEGVLSRCFLLEAEGTRQLIAAGAPGEVNHNNNPALAEAIRRNELGRARMFLDAGANPRRILDWPSCLLQAGTLLHLAWSPEAARLVVACGVDVNAGDRRAETALHRAAAGDLVHELVDLGANMEARNQFGQTPLMTMAKLFKPFPCVMALLGRGARLDAVDSKGKSAFEHLAENKDQELSAMLRAHNARQAAARALQMVTTEPST